MQDGEAGAACLLFGARRGWSGRGENSYVREFGNAGERVLVRSGARKRKGGGGGVGVMGVGMYQ